MERYQDIFEQMCKIIEPEISYTSYTTWIEPLRIVQIENDVITIEAPHELSKNFISVKYVDMLTEALKKVTGKKLNLEILTVDEIDKYHPFAEKDNKIEEKKSQFNPKYTFDNFIVGDNNKYTHAFCLSVAEAPSVMYNPLFLYGGVGLGKTHLMHSIAHYILSYNPDYKIIYTTTETFSNELISAIKNKTQEAFKNKYRNIDMLLIDDIQFIAGKESTQEEFFHTFNALYEDHKQIILAADRPPKEMKTLEDRLRSRFEWGLIVDVQLPDYELRLAILKNKAKMIGVHIPMPVLQFLAESLHSNIRQLEGAVKKIGAQSFLSGVPVTEEIAKSCIAELSAGAEPQSKTVERIISKVASKYGMTSEDIKSRKKTKEIAYARHICIYIIRNITDMSLPTIGKIFGRDHSTVMASLSVIDNGKKKSPLLDVEIRDLIKEIKEG